MFSLPRANSRVLAGGRHEGSNLVRVHGLPTAPANSSYDVVIVGGAMMGASTAWFLSDNADFNGSPLGQFWVDTAAIIHNGYHKTTSAVFGM